MITIFKVPSSVLRQFWQIKGEIRRFFYILRERERERERESFIHERQYHSTTAIEFVKA